MNKSFTGILGKRCMKTDREREKGESEHVCV